MPHLHRNCLIAFALSALLMLSLTGEGLAQADLTLKQSQDDQAEQVPITIEQRIGEIYDRLGSAETLEEADDLEEQLSLLFDQKSGPTAELLMEWSREAASENDHELSLEIADTAKYRFPDFAAASYQSSMALRFLGEDVRALSVLFNMLKDEPRYVHAYIGIASLFANLGEMREAIQSIREGLKISPHSGNLNGFLKQLQNGFEREI